MAAATKGGMSYANQWRKKNPERAKELHAKAKRKYRYGIDEGEFQRLLVTQGGNCAICGEGCKTGNALSVDHDHNTGRIRGLLCLRCNAGIGHLNDDVARVERALQYLKGI